MTFEKYLTKTVPFVEKELDYFLKDFLTCFKAYKRLLPFFSAFIDANKNGKRIRGSLIVLGYELSGKKADKKIYQLAALFELIQTGLLIHDDLIDRSDLRRGRPSIYAQFGSGHYAISQGISLGDLAFFYAEEKLSELNFSNGIQTQLSKEINSILSDTLIGQLLDVSLQHGGTIPNEEDIFLMIDKKTAVYTFSGPLHLGSIAQGVKKSTQTIYKFGKHLGIAFQIQDDILGIYGDESVIGKSNKSDIQEGKMTVLYAYALSHITKAQRMKLAKIYGYKNILAYDVETVRNIFDKSGARKHAEKIARAHFDNALSGVEKVTTNKQYQALLFSLIEYIKHRNK